MESRERRDKEGKKRKNNTKPQICLSDRELHKENGMRGGASDVLTVVVARVTCCAMGKGCEGRGEAEEGRGGARRRKRWA